MASSHAGANGALDEAGWSGISAILVIRVRGGQGRRIATIRRLLITRAGDYFLSVTWPLKSFFIRPSANVQDVTTTSENS